MVTFCVYIPDSDQIVCTLSSSSYLTLVGSSIFNMVSNLYMKMIRAYADSVTACSSKEQCKYKYMIVWIDMGVCGLCVLYS